MNVHEVLVHMKCTEPQPVELSKHEMYVLVHMKCTNDLVHKKCTDLQTGGLVRMICTKLLPSELVHVKCTFWCT